MGVMQHHVSSASTEGNNFLNLTCFSNFLNIFVFIFILRFDLIKRFFVIFSNVLQSTPTGQRGKAFDSCHGTEQKQIQRMINDFYG